ncbi:TPA: hypothetical protein ACH3X1_015517 [Trebouxia sp. C0004]
MGCCVQHTEHYDSLNNYNLEHGDSIVTVQRFCNSSTAQHTTFGWLRYSGFVRHKEPSLDAVGALADLLVFTFNLTGLDILQTIEAQETSWWQYRLLFRDLHHADKKQDHNSLAKPLQSILQEVEGHPVVKTKVLHLFRDSGVILLASGGAGLELLQICGPWARGSLGQAYIERNLLAALQAFAIPGGWEQTSFMKRHFLGRALVAVPDECIDRLLPGVRRVNELVKARNSWLQTGGKRQAHDKVSDRAAEGFLQTTLYTGVAFWQNLPFRTQRLPAVADIVLTPEYEHFAEAVMTSDNKADQQAALDISPAMGDILTDMQSCLQQLCGSSMCGDPEAVARLIAKKIAAMNNGAGCEDNMLSSQYGGH